MNPSEKLSLIKDLLGYTQQELANHLKVSFVTVNSWLRGKSTPHPKTLERINHVLSSLIGDSSLMNDTQARLAYIESQRKIMGNILPIIVTNPDIADSITLALTYNTNRIEGSTLSEKETQAILFNHATLPNKTLVEQMEAINHKAAWIFLLSHLQAQIPLDINLILKLHSILMNGIHDDAGIYRQHPVRIVGAKTITANYVKVPFLMEDLISEINHKKIPIIEKVANVHSRFEQIHPFSDGNGRVGRLLMQAMLIRADYPVAIIRQEKKQMYYDVLELAQIKDDPMPLQTFIIDAMTYGVKLLTRL